MDLFLIGRVRLYLLLPTYEVYYIRIAAYFIGSIFTYASYLLGSTS